MNASAINDNSQRKKLCYHCGLVVAKPKRCDCCHYSLCEQCLFSSRVSLTGNAGMDVKGPRMLLPIIQNDKALGYQPLEDADRFPWKDVRCSEMYCRNCMQYFASLFLIGVSRDQGDENDELLGSKMKMLRRTTLREALQNTTEALKSTVVTLKQMVGDGARKRKDDSVVASQLRRDNHALESEVRALTTKVRALKRRRILSPATPERQPPPSPSILDCAEKLPETLE